MMVGMGVAVSVGASVGVDDGDAVSVGVFGADVAELVVVKVGVGERGVRVRVGMWVGGGSVGVHVDVQVGVRVIGVIGAGGTSLDGSQPINKSSKQASPARKIKTADTVTRKTLRR